LTKLARVLARYWYVIILLLGVISLQLGAGFVTVNGDTPLASLGNPSAKFDVTITITATRTPLPTLTPTLTRTPTPTFTASPTRTPTPRPAKTMFPTDTPPPTATSTVTQTPSPQPTPLGQGKTLDVPVLMYHYVSQPPADADAIRLDLSVPPPLFEEHLAFLRQAGYETITMRDLSYALSGHKTLPPKPIIITFDDGYRDNYENAFPLLRDYGYTGTFFIFTQVIDTNNIRFVTWDMVKEMHQAGMEFGSHSYRHSDLSGRDADFLIYEILGSKEAIEERIGEPVRFFSYPAGRYDALTMRIVESANFWAAVTTQWGGEHTYADRFELLRLRVRGNDTVDDLALKLNSF
jgi:peptidoglycan/xylan/chitin deacetylase (PgdA/CDA1 family)